MNTITIDLSPETYKRLEEQAQKVGQAVEVLSRELLEAALKSSEVVRPCTTREVLQAAGRARPLSEALRSKILPDVTLDEVRAILAHAAGPSLSDIIQEQRGIKA
jgi:plasmid stability protein